MTVSSLPENMVAINLMRKYGRNDAVYFYNKGIEIDFYVPDAGTAVQFCFDIDINTGTFEREVRSLLKITEVLECRRLLIIKRDTERMMEKSGKKIEVIPVMHFIRQKNKMPENHFQKNVSLQKTGKAESGIGGGRTDRNNLSCMMFPATRMVLAFPGLNRQAMPWETYFQDRIKYSFCQMKFKGKQIT